MKNGFKRIAALGFIFVLVLGLLAGCGESGNKTPTEPIQIASKPMTEQFILTEMLKQLIEADTDYKAEITKGVGGGTSNIQPALLKGDFDLYPEYTGTAWLNVLKKTEIPEDAVLLEELEKDYEDQFKLEWVGMYGFNNTYTLAVRNEIAEQYNLESYSDLAAHSGNLVFGGNADFQEREDGFPALCKVYHMKFKDTVDIDIGLKYQALAKGQIDVTNAYTTDAQLSVADVKLLKDDKKFFKNYYCGTVVRQDTLKKYPELKAVLMKMDGILTNDEMASLNYQVEVNKKDEADVAREFLQSKGLLKK